MPTQDDIANQQQLLAAHRARLAHYLRQRALLGMAYEPPGVAAGIAEARPAIQRCKVTLRNWGIAVEDYPDDDERAVAPAHDSAPAMSTTALAIKRVTLLIEGDVQQFTPEQQAAFVFLLARVVNVSPEAVRIVKLESGSIKLTLDMPEDAAERLIALYAAADPALEPLGLLNVEFQGVEVRKDARQMLRDSEGASGYIDRDSEQDKSIYNVVVNDEEQYSLWPVDREIPSGWRAVGISGPKDECLAYIKEVWTDMRPLSLRRKMEEDERRKMEGDERGLH